MKSHIIQPKIKITQEFVDKIIKRYSALSPHYHLSIGSWTGNRDDIIKEIKSVSKIGKQILLMDYKFKQAYPELVKEMEVNDENKRTNKQNI